MCAVSAITDYYREKWPLPRSDPNQVDPSYWQPNIKPKDWLQPKPIVITKEQWDEYQELKRRMEAYDAATGQPDCVKPEVSIWEAEIRKIVQQELEKK